MTSTVDSQPASSKSSRGYRLGRLGRMVRKELSEILRDRRTLMTLILMPLLLYPLLGLAFYQIFRGDRLTSLVAPHYRIGIISEEEHSLVRGYLTSGESSLLERHQLVRLDPAQREKEALEGSPLSEIRPRTEYLLSTDPPQDLRNRLVDVVIRMKGADSMIPRPGEPLEEVWEVLYCESSERGRQAYRYVQKLCNAASSVYLSRRIRRMGIPQRADPVRLEPAPVKEPAARRGSWLSAVVPLILILMTITGAVYPAIDLTAGERERGTLEILVAAPIPRMSVLLAKYAAVLTVAFLTALMNLGPMMITLVVTGLTRELFLSAGVLKVALLLVQLLALLMLFTAFFSAVLLAVTSFARSFKEAQAYLIPLMLLSLTPGVLGLLPGLELGMGTALVPLLNIVLLARDLLDGEASPGLSLVVIGATLLYALLAISVAARVFGTEAVVASQPGKWSRRFRRLFHRG